MPRMGAVRIVVCFICMCDLLLAVNIPEPPPPVFEQSQLFAWSSVAHKENCGPVLTNTEIVVTGVSTRVALELAVFASCVESGNAVERDKLSGDLYVVEKETKRRVSVTTKQTRSKMPTVGLWRYRSAKGEEVVGEFPCVTQDSPLGIPQIVHEYIGDPTDDPFSLFFETQEIAKHLGGGSDDSRQIGEVVAQYEDCGTMDSLHTLHKRTWTRVSLYGWLKNGLADSRWIKVEEWFQYGERGRRVIEKIVRNGEGYTESMWEYVGTNESPYDVNYMNYKWRMGFRWVKGRIEGLYSGGPGMWLQLGLDRDGAVRDGLVRIGAESESLQWNREAAGGSSNRVGTQRWSRVWDRLSDDRGRFSEGMRDLKDRATGSDREKRNSEVTVGL